MSPMWTGQNSSGVSETVSSSTGCVGAAVADPELIDLRVDKGECSKGCCSQQIAPAIVCSLWNTQCMPCLRLKFVRNGTEGKGLDMKTRLMNIGGVTLESTPGTSMGFRWSKQRGKEDTTELR